MGAELNYVPKVGGVPEGESRSWWQDGVLGRLELEARGDLLRTLRLVATGEEGLGLDGLIVTAQAVREPKAAFETARGLGIRLLIELAANGSESAQDLAAAAYTWLQQGAAGIAIELPSRATAGAGRARVTRLFGEPGDGGPVGVPETIRAVIDSHPDTILAARRPDDPGPSPRGPHLVIETTLSRQPWRAASFRAAIDETLGALPAGYWPGHSMGAPRRGPFAVGLSIEDALRCSAALHLTLRGTPCVELGQETGLPNDASRRWWYRCLIDLRRQQAALYRGALRQIPQGKAVLGYLREHEAERLVVLLNLGRRTRTGHLPTGFAWSVLFGPHEGSRLAGGDVSLPGCGVLIARAGAPQSRTLGSSGQRRAAGR